eukprot:Gb_38796 [translate_table: standard]
MLNDQVIMQVNHIQMIENVEVTTVARGEVDAWRRHWRLWNRQMYAQALRVTSHVTDPIVECGVNLRKASLQAHYRRKWRHHRGESCLKKSPEATTDLGDTLYAAKHT